MKLSIVSPVYRAEALVDKLVERIQMSVEKITDDYEVILVEDGGPDNSWDKIELHCRRDPRIKGIKLSRNFGQHYAITAGLDNCKGDWVVVMDCDLQDQPEEIVKMYNKAIEGYDIVVGRRAERKDGFLKKLSSKSFAILLEYLSGAKIDNSVGNYSISSKKVIENFNKLHESNRNFGLFINWLGFKKAFINVEHAKRPVGKSSYNFYSLLKHALNTTLTYSNKPLRFSIKFGFFMSFFSVIYALYLIIRYFYLSINVPGWTSMMVSLFFVTGLILSTLGLMGLYIGKIFDETKNRPLYIVKDAINIE